ncbi:MAG: transposase [Armatimonadetes bacterium]|nr:transposase [Armatimonadota bacterium]
MPNFKQMPMTPSQVLLFPMSVEESVPKDCDVRVLGEAVDLLDWSAFEAGYSETGSPPYPPKVLAKILVYGYSKGMRSSRALEDAVKNDKRYIWLAGGLEPDHCTIVRFRKQKASELRAAYRGSVRICSEAGLILLDVTATDGSKIKARASSRSPKTSA